MAEHEAQLSTTFAALSDPTRRAILARLVEGEATLTELAELFPWSVQTVSRHLKVLEHAGLVTRGRTAQLRPAKLRGLPLLQAIEWLAQYRGSWEDRLERLEAELRDE